MYPKIVLTFIMTAGLSALVSAQSFFDRLGQHLHPRIEVGGHIGTAGYIGDISNPLFATGSLSGGLGAKYYFNPIHEQDRTWGVRFDINYIQIKGSDSKGSLADQDRNLNFTNNIIEIAPAMEFHWWEFRSNRTKTLYSPYAFAGIGGLFHNPKTLDPNDPGKKVSLIDEEVEFKIKQDGNPKPLKKFVPYGNIGLGMKMNLSKSLAPWSIGVEVNYRYAWSNFLDGVGNRYYESYDKLYRDPDQEIRDAMLPGDTYVPSPAHEEWLIGKERWEKLAGPHQKLTYDELSGKAPGNIVPYKRGESRFNDSYVTTVFRVTYTLYKWRDPQWK